MSKLYVSIMMVALLALVCTSAFAVTTTWDVQSPELTPVADDWVQEIPITAQVKCYIQIIYQDNDIGFVNDKNPGDWFRARADGLIGAYGSLDPLNDDDKSSCSAWADGYYESRDGAHLYVQTNNPLTMDIHRKGDLETVAGDIIPTWWTLAASGNWALGFLVGGQWVADVHGTPDGKLPLDGAGGYAGLNNPGLTPGGTIFLGGQPPYPNQHAFACAPDCDHFFLKLPCPTRGTLEFKARMLRTSIAWGATGELIPDQAGDYSTALNVTFTSP